MRRGSSRTPEARARIAEAQRRRSPLRDLTDEQRRLYRYLRSGGIGRDDALREARR